MLTSSDGPARRRYTPAMAQETPEELERMAQRLRIALELHTFGVEMQRQNLRRRHPDEDDEQIRRRLNAWLREPREELDPAFRVVPWPR